jgi:hypothetical protein
MTTWITDGSYTGVTGAIGTASANDVVLVPSGTFSWPSSLAINKTIIVSGAGTGLTNINLTSDIIISLAGRVTSMTLSGSNGGDRIIAGTNSANWRFDNLVLNNGISMGRCLYADTPGLIDHCIINDNLGGTPAENIWTTASGGTSAHTVQDNIWASNTTPGSGLDAIYVENCTFNNNGYVSDFGYGSKAVVRYCTINGINQVDAHGPESNWRSCRQVEIYGNRWTITGSQYYTAFNIRGGLLIAFDNLASGSASDWMLIHHYGPESNSYGESYAPLLAHDWWTPAQYPLPDQQGIGPNPLSSGGADPCYVFNNTRAGVEWGQIWTQGLGDGTAYTNEGAYPTGTTGIYITGLIGSLYTGNIVQFSGDTNYYRIASQRAGSGLMAINPPGLLQSIPSSTRTFTYGPFTKYGYQLGSGSPVSFTMNDIIGLNRDIFLNSSGFNGASGVGRGTKAQMMAIAGTKNNVGYWVTDESSWNTTVPANTAGQLYRWNGSSWTLRYTPYTYPHPLINAGIGTVYILKRLGSHIKFKGLAPV